MFNAHINLWCSMIQFSQKNHTRVPFLTSPHLISSLRCPNGGHSSELRKEHDCSYRVPLPAKWAGHVFLWCRNRVCRAAKMVEIYWYCDVFLQNTWHRSIWTDKQHATMSQYFSFGNNKKQVISKSVWVLFELTIWFRTWGPSSQVGSMNWWQSLTVSTFNLTFL